MWLHCSQFGTIEYAMKWVKKLENNLYEIRSKRGNNIQRVIYFRVVDNRYVITHGFTKKHPRKKLIKVRK
ncbi:type II toxin-antitoxin system RelE/ParE family toxin [Mammaliicoccus sciuri]|uniref:type II toxin-antitoxin system RelE/ParE family toxin n=1 Tax=Mammaliicoccus sciuri TaxID=1296 RepID=UPI003F56BAF2